MMHASSYLWPTISVLTVSKTFTDYHLIFRILQHHITFKSYPIFLSIFQYTIHKNIINLHIYNNMIVKLATKDQTSRGVARRVF